MPISKIQVNEYQCMRCSYKWINRVNGKDGPIPNRCAKCKTSRWDENAMTPKEKGLRKRVKGLRKLYRFEDYHWSDLSTTDSLSDDIIREFLEVRPTVEELKKVMRPPGLSMEPLTSENQYSRKGFVPVPDKPGWFKYDPEEYKKNRILEAQKRQEIMRQITDTRHKDI